MVAPGSVTAGRFGLLEYHVAPHSPGAAPHLPLDVLRVVLRAVGRADRLPRGVVGRRSARATSRWCTRAGAHGFRNDGDEEAAFLILFAPGIARENFFLEMAELRRSGRTLHARGDDRVLRPARPGDGRRLSGPAPSVEGWGRRAPATGRGGRRWPEGPGSSVSSTTPSRPRTAAPSATAWARTTTREEAEHARGVGGRAGAEADRGGPRLGRRLTVADRMRAVTDAGHDRRGTPGRPEPVKGVDVATSARWRIWSSGCWAAPVRRAAGWRSGWPPSASASCSGSRDAERAAEVAAEVAGRAAAAAGGVEVSVQGGSNVDVAGAADLVIIAVPFAGHAATLAELATPLAGKVVVDCVVPMGFDELGAYVLRRRGGQRHPAGRRAAARQPRRRGVPPPVRRPARGPVPAHPGRRRHGRRRRPRGHRPRAGAGRPAARHARRSTPAGCATPARSRR